MAYEQAIYKKVLSSLEAQRMVQKSERKRRLFEVYQVCPEVKRIDEEIDRVGSGAALEILNEPHKADAIALDLKESMRMLSDARGKALEKAGFSKDYTDMRYKCAVCKDEGYIDGKMCECFSELVRRELREESKLFNLFETQGFDKFDIELFSDEVDKKAGVSQKEAMEEALAVCRDFAQKFDAAAHSLFFYGGVGLGKTFLSTCIAKELIESGYTVMYQSAAKLFSYYSDYLFGRVNASQARLELDKLIECDLLIIDDLGSEAANAQTVSFLFEIVNDRLLSGRKMVISTNYSINEIAKVYSERLHSRILEHFAPIRFFGADIRLKKMFG